MFVGHLAVGLAAKRAAPRTSMGTLLLAALVADLLVWSLVVAGIEHVAIKPGITVTNPFDLYDYPISHSLLMDVVWGALLAGAYYLVRRYRRGSLLIFAAVVSHWVLDFISHRPDMPLAPGVHKYFGLGLYNSRPGMLIVEGLLWLAGIIIYLGATRSKGWLGHVVFWVPVALLTLIWVQSTNGASPPGNDMATIGMHSLIFMAVMIGWGYWADHLRIATASAAPPPRADRAAGA